MQKQENNQIKQNYRCIASLDGTKDADYLKKRNEVIF